MKAYQRQFIEFALRNRSSPGEFTLKLVKSPYFFNAGLFNSGRDLRPSPGRFMPPP